MSGTVCSLPAACVIRSYVSITLEDALPSWQARHNCSCTRGSRLDICE
jgi:hypothetical protein